MQVPPSRDRYCVAVTFDDGYRDNFVHAFPILKRLGIPVTIFLTTGYIESGQLPWYDHVRLAFKLTSRSRLSLQELGGPGASLETEDDRLDAMQHTINWLRTVDDDIRRSALAQLLIDLGIPAELNLPGTMLSWNEIRQMQRAGVEFGAHTVTHPVLRTLSVERLVEEIVGCKTSLENRLQVNVSHFAYPFGKPADLSDSAKRTVRSAGFRTAVTTIPGFNVPGQDLFEPKRLNLEESDPALFGLKFDWSRISHSTQIDFTDVASV
jgi:peptidoglycan/xylan/chitin deacetylase (PgdA/CDA1 family)